MALNDLIISYNNLTEAQASKSVITATYWNRLFNILLTQSDANATVIKNIIDILHEATGAANIGVAPITGVAGTTVQTIADSLKTLVDDRYTTTATDELLGLKADKTVVAKSIKDITYDSSTGKFTFVKQDGTTTELDTILEKVVVNFSYDKATQSLVLALADGTTTSVSLSDFINDTEILGSSAVDVSFANGKFTISLKAGMITDTLLDPTVLQTMLSYKNAAATSASNAAVSEANALTYKNNAAASASSATASASNAATAKTDAENAEATAIAKATEASTSASNAALSESNAATSETNASASKNSAATSETNAAKSATAAAASEANALTYKNNAATSETNAASSETTATNAASTAVAAKNDAASSKTTATTKATEAATSASEAAASAVSAANSAANAADIVGGDYVTNTELTGHTANTILHFTTSEKTKLSYVPDNTTTALSNKVDKVTGKSLSTNDYTTTEKNKLQNIAANAQVNVIETVKVNGVTLTPTSKAVDVTVPINVSDFTNDSGYLMADDIANKENKPTYVTISLTLANWINGVYSFETTYPVATYDLEIQPSSTCTQVEIEAWGAALITSVMDSNTIKALGDIPTINIPVILKVVAK